MDRKYTSFKKVKYSENLYLEVSGADLGESFFFGGGQILIKIWYPLKKTPRSAPDIGCFSAKCRAEWHLSEPFSIVVNLNSRDMKNVLS